MCYKTVESKRNKELAEIMKMNRNDHEMEVQPSYNINAFSNPSIHIIAQDEPDYITTATWGLVPFWGQRDPATFLAKNNYTLNARGEDFWETKSYKPYVQEGRCVMLFDGFYEPHTIYQKDKKKPLKQPYFCYIPEDGKDFNDRKQLQIGGIYSKVGGEYYVTLVTTEANDLFAKIHNAKKRMPLVLDDKLVKEWIAPNQSKSVIDDLVRDGFTSQQMHAHAVTNDIYKTDFLRDGKENIEPVAQLEKII